MKIAIEGLPFILPPLGIGIFLLLWGLTIPGILLLVLGLFLAFFFRDPHRIISQNNNLILSPADGRVIQIAPAPEEEKNRGRVQMISIFLSLFDVHINRSPMKGKIVELKYIPGKFLPAFKKEASKMNERNIVEIENGNNSISLHQIAGILARRVVLWKKKGEYVNLGEKLGIMKFGSRVDLFLPENVLLRVKKGQRVKGGISILGELK